MYSSYSPCDCEFYAFKQYSVYKTNWGHNIMSIRSFKAKLASNNQTWGSSVLDMYCVLKVSRSLGKPAFRRDSPSSSCRYASTVEVCQILESPCQIYLRMNPETGDAVEKSGREWGPPWGKRHNSSVCWTVLQNSSDSDKTCILQLKLENLKASRYSEGILFSLHEILFSQLALVSKREVRCCNDAPPTSYCTSSLVLSTSFGSFTRPLLATVSISYG